MEIGFFFWPYDPPLVQRMAAAAEQYGYDMIGIADAPGNAMDPWVAAIMVAQATARSSISASRPRIFASRRTSCGGATARAGDADARRVDELGLFDYLARRFAIFGTPDQCLEQLCAAQDAGLTRAMFTVSLASDPARTVELFGERVLPELRR